MCEYFKISQPQGIQTLTYNLKHCICTHYNASYLMETAHISQITSVYVGVGVGVCVNVCQYLFAGTLC